MSREILELVRMRDMVAGGLVGPLRRGAGLTQAEIARECNVHPSTVAYWERGHVPRGDAAVKYARLLLELESLARR
jgi:Helix-turn-helix.